MLQLSRIFWGICRLKSNPQDLPKGIYLLVSAIFAGILVDSFSSSILIAKLSNSDILQAVVFYNLASLLAVYFLVRLVGFRERGIQTVTAVAGSGVFISLVLLPALLVINTNTKAATSFAFLILADNVWRIIVNAHIFRHALSIGLLMAMILSVSYLLFGVLIADFVLPTQTS